MDGYDAGTGELGTDYNADLTSSQIRIDYRAPGQYFVKVDAVGPSGAFSQIFHDHVDDFFAEDPEHGIMDKGGVSREIDDPSADLGNQDWHRIYHQ